jgi:hypothetical protein
MQLIESYETPTFYQNYLAMRNTADGTGDKPIAVWSQSISGVSAINPLVAFYDIHEGKREVLFFYFAPDTTRDLLYTRYIELISNKAKRVMSMNVDGRPNRGRFHGMLNNCEIVIIFLLLPTLIPQRWVGTTCFHHVVIQIRLQ